MQACCTVFGNAVQIPVEGALRAGRLCLAWVLGGMQVAGTPGGCAAAAAAAGLRIAVGGDQPGISASRIL